MEYQGGVHSITDPQELTYMLGELYAMKRRDAQVMDQQSELIHSLQNAVVEQTMAADRLEAETIELKSKLEEAGLL